MNGCACVCVNECGCVIQLLTYSNSDGRSTPDVEVDQ